MHTSEPSQSLTFELIEQARRRIAGQVALTPFEWGSNLSDITGSKLYFKLENLQITGSFKERGACNRLLMMPMEQRAAGVVAASAGNHAQGVALHATRLGFRSTIVMPEATSLMKIARTRRYGAEVVLHGATYDDAYAHARTLCEERGAVFIHPFDDVGIMAGQGTIGLEMIEQNPYLQTVIVPIGGGGLISGIAVALKEANPRIRVVGVQTSAFPSMKAA
ncbi:MAG: pyridoxal-phosphate dependent enzyme, partial [Myxococcales bacterium]|nr:pyridoxal-phosphate dependent enzyme [Myxococcales bacterium]